MSNYKYFLYSEEQYKEKNTILNKAGKIFEPGTVVVNGTRKKYTQLSSTPTMERYIDTKIIAEGDLNNIVYTSPRNIRKGEI